MQDCSGYREEILYLYNLYKNGEYFDKNRVSALSKLLKASEGTDKKYLQELIIRMGE